MYNAPHVLFGSILHTFRVQHKPTRSTDKGKHTTIAESNFSNTITLYSETMVQAARQAPALFSGSNPCPDLCTKWPAFFLPVRQEKQGEGRGSTGSMI